MIKILIVDDQPHIRRVVRGLVEAEHDWVVCGEAANGQQATEQCALLAPDLIILDINMPVMNGFEAAKIIHMRSPEVLILISTTDSSVHFARAASKTGASGFLSKANSGEHLVEAMASLLNARSIFWQLEGAMLQRLCFRTWRTVTPVLWMISELRSSENLRKVKQTQI